MTAFLFIPIIILVLVTPFRIAIRGIFNSARMYSVTNLTLLGFLLTVKLRMKIEENRVYYSLNNQEIKEIKVKGQTVEKARYGSKDVRGLIVIKKVDIKLKYGVADDAMRTALESSVIYNTLMMVKRFIKIEKVNIEVLPEFNSEVFALDIDVRTRYALMQIIIAALRILKRRREHGKYRKSNASNTT